MVEKTYLAPALRSTEEEVLKENELIVSQKFFKEIFGTIPGIAAVINTKRQIVFTNNDFLSLFGIQTLEPVLGKRHGEVLSCIHAEEGKNECGTSEACVCCGAVNAILESQKTGCKSMKEARISAVVNGKQKSLDLNFTSSPITVGGQLFYAIMLQDISDEKRRSTLERIFFHDLLNSAGGLNGLLSILKEETYSEEARELINLAEEASRNILDEILLQRQLRAAENGDLVIKIEPINSMEFLNSTIGTISFHNVAKNKQIVITGHYADINFETDRILFQRVIINLLKNALEATCQEGTVMAGFEERGEKIRFRVKNEGVIPKDVRMQIFQRSFSTKGQNRGLGTYSIRLLTENYLKGKVSFISNEKDGTIFSVDLNKSWSGR